jgi:DNA-binding CsgD family transcriptional regulator
VSLSVGKLPWTRQQLTAHSETCAALIRAIGQENFAAALAALLSSLVLTRSIVMTAYDLGEPPRTLFHNVDNQRKESVITLYDKGPYKLDPFFLACVIDNKRGEFRLRDVAPDSFTRTPYFLKYYRLLRIGEEVGLIIPLGRGAGVVISLESGSDDEQFSDEEIGVLNAVFPIVDAAATRQWGGATLRNPEQATAAVAALFSGFGAGVLSQREREVIRLVLQGHSSKSIALELGIAAGTVKIHRKHAYQKLGVATQAQLFQKFMGTIRIDN